MLKREALEKLLSHPILLLFLTAAISGYLVPHITRRWQDHQKELELKTALASSISDAVASMVIATESAESVKLGEKGGQTQDEYRKAFRDWSVASAVIGSKLRVYFPGTELGQNWDDYSELVTTFYRLEGAPNEGIRRERLQKLRAALGPSASNIDWEVLANERFSRELAKNWLELKRQLLRQKDGIVQSILMKPISAFR